MTRVWVLDRTRRTGRLSDQSGVLRGPNHFVIRAFRALVPVRNHPHLASPGVPGGGPEGLPHAIALRDTFGDADAAIQRAFHEADELVARVFTREVQATQAVVER